MKKIFLILCIFFFLTPGILYAKTLPQTKKSVGKTTVTRSGSSVTLSIKLRRDRKALNVYFGNLGMARSVSYTLVYSTNGKQEGAVGSINTNGQTSTSRELLFGTCSSGICRYHSNISNMTFEVSIETSSGKTILKRYRVKV